MTIPNKHLQKDTVIALPDTGFSNFDSGDYYSFLARQVNIYDWYLIWGEISDATCETASLFLLQALFGGKKQVTLMICSNGGDEDSARALIGVIELCKQSGMIIRVYGAGQICSAAFDIFTACSEGYRFAFEATMFMIHSSSGHVEDKAMYDLQCELDEWSLRQYTCVAPETIARFLDTGNWWFDPMTAIGYGVCDAVIKVGTSLPDGPVNPERKTHDQQKKEARRKKFRRVVEVVEEEPGVD